MKVSEYIKSLQPYVPGKPIEETKRQYGIQEVYKLASNENPLGPSPKALAAISQALKNLHLYPDGSCYSLRVKMSSHFKVPGDWLLFGNGSDEIVDYLVRTFCENGDRILTSQMAFHSYPLSAQAARCETTFAPLTEDFRFDLKAMKSLWTSRHKLIFITNPNNPTGTYNTRDEVEDFLKFFGGRDDVIVVFDEAYFEFVRALNYPDALDYVRRYNNVVTLRTFSKVYGLAGLRVGVLIGHPDITSLLNRVRKPFNVNALAQVAATAAVDDVEHLEKTRQLTWKGLDFFYLELKRLGLTFVPSQANFVLFDGGRDSAEIFEALLRKGVILRPLKNYNLPTYLRMSVGLEYENEKAIACLEEVLNRGAVH